MRNPRRQIVLFVLSALGVALLAAPASAKTCAQKVIDDWVESPRIDGVYPLHCYREAIAALPEDAATYSSAADDINRALQQRIREGSGATGGTTSPTETDGTPTTTGPTDGSGGGGAGTGGTSGDSGTGGTPDGSGSGVDEPDGVTPDGETPAPAVEGSAAAPSEQAFAADLGDGGDSLPLPVVVVIAALGIVAVAVAATIVIRRLPNGGSGPPNAPSGPSGS